MNSKQWRQQIDTLYFSALEREPNQRRAFLAEACDGDEELRRELEALLAQDDAGYVQSSPPADFRRGHTLSPEDAAENLSPCRSHPFTTGNLLADRFRIIREVGRGGMGLVYEAVDEKLNRHVALKCAYPGYGHRLPPEVCAAREVSHFNVCKVHDLHRVSLPPDDDIEFVSMEFIDGQTLEERVSHKGKLLPAEARQIASQICAGLAQAHRQNIIHGDLKCSNVILSKLPQGGVRAVITDFGLAKQKSIDGARVKGDNAGTVDYMAPELLLGERATVASDLYALGILFHVILTGHCPKRSQTPTPRVPQKPPECTPEQSTITNQLFIVEAHWQSIIEDLPSPWKNVIARCLAPLPENRFRSAEEVADALENRRPLFKWSVAAVVTTALAVGYWQWTAEPPPAPIRLAVLPFSEHGSMVQGAAGIGIDVAERLSGSRRNFKIISPHEAEENLVDTPEKAKNILGATHVLQTSLNGSDGKIVVSASLTDLGSGLTVGEPLNGTYNAGDTPALAKAIIATVTSAFRLQVGVPKESVSGLGYSYYVQGIDLLRQDAYNADKAIPYLNKAMELDPHSALPLAGLADAQIQKFQKEGGREWLELAGANVTKAKAMNPDSVPVLLASGSFQQEHGAYERAINDFTRAAELDPNNSETLKRLAGAYNKANRTDEAIAIFRKAIKAEPDYYANYLELGNLYWYRAQFPEAEEQYRLVTKIAPNLSSGHMVLGLALMKVGRFQEAEGSLLQALRLHKSARLLMNIGGLYYAQDRYKEALPFFEESISMGTPTAIRYRDLGDVYRHLERNAEAHKAYRSARDMAQEELTSDPRRAYSRITLALVSAFLGDKVRARAEAAQAVAMEPENAMVLREAAITYEVLHQRDDTLRLLRNTPRGLVEELSHQPDVKDLQKDPRFQEILRSTKPGNS